MSIENEIAKEELKRISEISVGERFRKTFINIEELAESIKATGLQNPIIINEQNQLVSGGRRLEAFKLLGEEFIPARIKNIKNTLNAEIDENNQRESFTISEKVAIAEAIEEAIGERRGKTSKGKKNQDVTNPDNCPVYEIPDGIETREFIAIKAGLGSSATLRRAKEVITNAIPEVIDAVDNGLVSVNFAHKISTEPKKRQLSMLDEAITEDPATDSPELSKKIKERRKAKRKERFNCPEEFDSDPIYSLVFMNPDWSVEIDEQIKDYPVLSYINPSCGTLCMVVPHFALDRAFSIIEHWSLTYKSLISIYTKKSTDDGFAYTTKPVTYLLIAQIAEDDAGHELIEPVWDRQEHDKAILEIVSNCWPDENMMRIDMTGTEPRHEWAVWKLDYAKKNSEVKEVELDEESETGETVEEIDN